MNNLINVKLTRTVAESRGPFTANCRPWGWQDPRDKAGETEKDRDSHRRTDRETVSGRKSEYESKYVHCYSK